MSVYNSIVKGLEQALSYEKGCGRAYVQRYSISSLTRYSSEDIRAIRVSAGLTQRSFAMVFGVSIKTVEAWESGKNSPSGPALRLMSMMKSDPEFLARYKLCMPRIKATTSINSVR